MGARGPALRAGVAGPVAFCAPKTNSRTPAHSAARAWLFEGQDRPPYTSSSPHLERDRRRRARLGLDLDALLGLDRLVHAGLN